MATESSAVETLLTWNTVYSADSVEWCPVEPHLNILVCGTYQLQNKEGVGDKESAPYKRLGRIYLFQIDINTISLEPIQTIETSAVLDQKWCQHSINGSPYLGVVNAAGFLQIYKLTKQEELYKLDLVTQLDISSESKVLALSLDWSTGKTESEAPHIVISDSGGNITECVLQADGNVVKLNSWNAHSFEAWICAFDYWNTDIIYTGGDDCCFKVFDTRCGGDAKLVNRCHEAGVTSLHSNSMQENILASGSYDETLRLWDTRRLKRPIAEQALGGGIWRTKWDPINHEVLLVACMYGGFRIVDTTNCSALSVLEEYNEHSSIAYGADWCKDISQFVDDPSNTFCRVFSTCSFYDCKLNVAQIKY